MSLAAGGGLQTRTIMRDSPVASADPRATATELGLTVRARGVGAGAEAAGAEVADAGIP